MTKDIYIGFKSGGHCSFSSCESKFADCYHVKEDLEQWMNTNKVLQLNLPDGTTLIPWQNIAFITIKDPESPNEANQTNPFENLNPAEIPTKLHTPKYTGGK